METLAVGETFLFEAFRLDRRGLFRRDERGVFVPVAIGSRALDVLRVLVEGHGDLVAKDEIMATVWPGIVVEENNLTLQMSALRRILDQGRLGGSCIQTVAGRGYRFIPTVTRCPGDTDLHHPNLSRTIAEVRDENSAPAPSDPSAILAQRRLGAWIHSRAALALIALFCATVAITAVFVQWSRPAAPNGDGGPAIVVMPFRNQGDGAAQANIGEAIAERIAVELARWPAARVVAQNTAAAFAGRPIDSRRLRRDLRVGYAVGGSVSAAGGNVHVEAALVDTVADAVRWSDHFDFADGESPEREDDIVTLIIRPLVLVLVQEVAARAAAKEPAEQTADDLVWRGWAAFYRAIPAGNRSEARELLERAVTMSPRNVEALSLLAHLDIAEVMNFPGPQDEAKLARADQLLTAAASIGRNDRTRYSRCILLRLQGRFEEAISICAEVIGDLVLRAFVYDEIGRDYLFLGQLEQATTAFETADRISRNRPRDAQPSRGSVPHLVDSRNWRWLRDLGAAYLFSGRYQEATKWLHQASNTVPGPVVDGARVLLTAAYALSGRQQEAVDTLAELQTRGAEILTNPDKLSAAIYLRPGTALAPRLQPVIEALRWAGLSEPMVAALLATVNGSIGEKSAGISAPADVMLGSSATVRMGD
jgi:DNA-binding winged helix-turn-helix (wHTH) protein/TolB-like protein